MESKIIKIRASQAYKIMTEPKLKADKEAGKLGETAKSYIEELFLFLNFGYKEPLMTDEILKGQLCEQDAMALVQEVFGGEFRAKCTERKENNYITGCADIVLKNEDYIEDVKTSWNIKTFFKAEPIKAYEIQAQCYMELYNKNNYRLIYCLVPTPDELIMREQKRYYWKFENAEANQDFIKICEQVQKNHDVVNQIEPLKRIKVFEFKRDPEFIKKLYSQIEKARVYYNSLNL